jgi:hypothetical protein
MKSIVIFWNIEALLTDDLRAGETDSKWMSNPTQGFSVISEERLPYFKRRINNAKEESEGEQHEEV